MEERIPKPGEFYKHFKGNLYQIITVATHTETGEAMVVYQALYGDYKTYCRPLEMFVSKVDHEKYPFVTQEYRFQLTSFDTDKVNSNSRISTQNNIEMYKDESNLEKVLEKEIKSNTNILSANKEQDNQELDLNPNLILFLDAKTYQDKLNILVSLKNKLDDRLLDDIAVSMDIFLEKGTLEERYELIKDNLLTLIRFECGRLR